MTTRRSTQTLTVLGALTLLGSAALVGCTSQTTPAEPVAGTTSASTTAAATPTATPAETPEIALARDYLDAVAAGDLQASWSMLSPESQAFYGSVETYEQLAPTGGTVTADEAAALSTATLVAAEGPEGAITVVSGATADAADAWIVRQTDSGLRIDDAGVPPTGESVYSWTNPAAGPEDQTGEAAYDPASPVTISFAVADPADGRSLVGSPETIYAWQGDQPVEATLDAGSDAQRTFVVNTTPETGPHAVTVVWQVGGDSHEWRSSTVLLTS
ncbi:hypothetical protein QCD70_17830 [Agreia sp. PsM10]|uniref:hypothetical protein n=1 Tax=Agreia sp. PsM10 TaxID=3030533 RepID=UPI00263A6595|nr:hypothetical protein [Agreia sp. PsM10]MDN4642110.1 hypothetical protein [Agreia sp. PsM10]